MAAGAPLWQPNRRSEGQCGSRDLRTTRTPAVANPSGYETADQKAPLFGVRPGGAPTDPEPRHVVHCSLVLPGPVRAEAARKALLVGADRGPVLGPARSRRGSQAGFATRALRGDRSRNGTIGGPGVFRSRNTSVWESQRHHFTMDLRIRRTAAPVASTRRRHRNARTYQREPLRGLLGSRTAVLDAVRPARTPRPEPPSGSSGSRIGWDFRGPPCGADLSSRPPAAAPLGSGTADYPSNDAALFQGMTERRAGRPTTGGHLTPRGVRLLERGRL